ncbi:MAG TPA: type II CAAX endopeptidase family protein [Gemmatimonadales bacterium]|nr:type II CAAX endopeptidase family protein [Gemmatimonadales bacterium]
MNPRMGALRGVAAYALLVFGAFPVLGRWLSHALRGADGIVDYLVGHSIQLVAILIFGAIAAAIEKRPFASFGLPWREALRGRFWIGALIGIGSLAALVLALCAVGALALGPPATSAFAAAGFGLAYAVVFLLLAVREEFLYRGYGQFQLAQVAGFWPAAVATTAWFVTTHANGGENVIGLLNVGLFGLVACLTLRRTGSLWLAIGFHAAWDWGETWLFGVADSGHAAAPGHLFTARIPTTAPAWLTGGPVGPEGSALCIALFVVFGFACVRWLRAPQRATAWPGWNAPGAVGGGRPE